MENISKFEISKPYDVGAFFELEVRLKNRGYTLSQWHRENFYRASEKENMEMLERLSERDESWNMNINADHLSIRNLFDIYDDYYAHKQEFMKKHYTILLELMIGDNGVNTAIAKKILLDPRTDIIIIVKIFMMMISSSRIYWYYSDVYMSLFFVPEKLETIKSLIETEIRCAGIKASLLEILFKNRLYRAAKLAIELFPEMCEGMDLGCLHDDKWFTDNAISAIEKLLNQIDIIISKDKSKKAFFKVPKKLQATLYINFLKNQKERYPILASKIFDFKDGNFFRNVLERQRDYRGIIPCLHQIMKHFQIVGDVSGTTRIDMSHLLKDSMDMPENEDRAGVISLVVKNAFPYFEFYEMQDPKSNGYDEEQKSAIHQITKDLYPVQYYCIIRYIQTGYLKINTSNAIFDLRFYIQFIRFSRIMMEMPTELQMLICNKITGSTSEFIPRELVEHESQRLRKFTKTLPEYNPEE